MDGYSQAGGTYNFVISGASNVYHRHPDGYTTSMAPSTINANLTSISNIMAGYGCMGVVGSNGDVVLLTADLKTGRTQDAAYRNASMAFLGCTDKVYYRVLNTGVTASNFKVQKVDCTTIPTLVTEFTVNYALSGTSYVSILNGGYSSGNVSSVGLTANGRYLYLNIVDTGNYRRILVLDTTNGTVKEVAAFAAQPTIFATMYGLDRLVFWVASSGAGTVTNATIGRTASVTKYLPQFYNCSTDTLTASSSGYYIRSVYGQVNGVPIFRSTTSDGSSNTSGWNSSYGLRRIDTNEKITGAIPYNLMGYVSSSDDAVYVCFLDSSVTNLSRYKIQRYYDKALYNL